MCGFAGFLGGTVGAGWDDALSENAVDALLRHMADTLVHRGPDDGGVWCDSEQRIGIGHRRLAVVDLSSTGHQPMVSESGRYVIAFNGEIYNHFELRAELGGLVSPSRSPEGLGKATWRGHSDTETLLAGFEMWGLETTLRKSIGMFAIALWDREARTLTLARDRLGEKPLYYGWQGSGKKRVFLFGSELKALKQHPAFTAGIDRNALCLLMRYNYIPAPYSIYQGIAKLEPGCLLTVSAAHPIPVVSRYWSASQVAQAGVTAPFAGTPTQAVDALEGLLKSAVQQQMMADVPLGAFLSGGIDSSTVVALMQSQSARPVKTFTIGFHEEGYNEAVHAKAVAQNLGADHTEMYVSPRQAMDVIPKLPQLYCEPFSDSSQIPTFLVSQLARQHVTVSLSGDAGDELFCGYTRYQMTARLWGKVSSLPRSLRRLAAGFISSVPPAAWDRLGGALPLSQVGDKLHKGASLLASNSVGELYRGMVSQWPDPANVVLGACEPDTIMNVASLELAGLSDVERMMALDMVSYLPDDILVKVDRAAMGVSLETRVPFLDHRVVEFAWSLPLDYKLRNGITKWPLRQVLSKYLPHELIERPKMGFGVPISQWLRGPLRDWAETLLSESRLRQEGFFDPAPIRRKWAEHLSGLRNWQHHLWGVLMFQAWLEGQRE